jgi:hypothetical protein
MNDRRKAEELAKVFEIIQHLNEVESIAITMENGYRHIYDLAGEIFLEGQTKKYPPETDTENKEYIEPFSYDVINMIAEEMHDLGKRMKSVEKENIILAKAVALMLSERE